MDVDPPHALQQQQPYAILRIKRKRNEEPLDALGEEGRWLRPLVLLLTMGSAQLQSWTLHLAERGQKEA